MRHSNQVALVVALTLGLAAPATAQARHFPPDEDFRLMLHYLVEDGATPGIVVGFVEDDGTTRIYSEGSAGPDARELGPQSAFEIGSITKTFTGILLADMVAKGEVALEDPVQKYLPDHVTMPTRSGRQITLRDLATHHSGLPRMPDNFEPADPSNPYADYTADQMYEFLSGHELRRDPGAEGEYSNLGVGLLGHVLERVSGQSYEELVRERILDPLDMDGTGITLEGALAEWMTRGHSRDGNVVSYWDVLTLAGAGGLRSNLEDMLKYLRANMNPPDNSLGVAIRASHEVQRSLEGNASIGLGWQIIDDRGRTFIMHGGGTGGFSTRIAFDPDQNVGYVLLTNTNGFPDDIGADFLRRGPPLAIDEVEVAPGDLAAFVGQYEMAPGRNLVVRLEDEGYLTLQAGQNVRFRMYAASDTSFFLKRTPWQFAFTRDEAGEVIGVEADLEGNPASAARVSSEVPAARPAPAPVIRDAELSEEDMAAYVGHYTLQAPDGTLPVQVYVEEGRLFAFPEGQRAYRLMAQGDHEFRLDGRSDIRLKFEVAGQRAVAVTVFQGGAEIRGEREVPGG